MQAVGVEENIAQTDGLTVSGPVASPIKDFGFEMQDLSNFKFSLASSARLFSQSVGRGKRVRRWQGFVNTQHALFLRFEAFFDEPYHPVKSMSPPLLSITISCPCDYDNVCERPLPPLPPSAALPLCKGIYILGSPASPT